MLTLLDVCKQNNLVEEKAADAFEIYPHKFPNKAILNKVVNSFNRRGFEVIISTDRWIRVMR